LVNLERLKKMMKEKKITQAQMAKKIGIKASTMNQKINGKRIITLSEGELIAKELGISDEDFGKNFFK